MDNQVNLETITDQAELNKMYVQCNENLLQAQQQVQIQQQNIQLIRTRLGQLESDTPKKK